MEIASPLLTAVPLVCVQKQLSWKGVFLCVQGIDVICNETLQESYLHLGIYTSYQMGLLILLLLHQCGFSLMGLIIEQLHLWCHALLKTNTMTWLELKNLTYDHAS